MNAENLAVCRCRVLGPEAVTRSAWQELTGGCLRIQSEEATPDWLHLIARVEPAPPARHVLTGVESEALLRVLCGEPLKAIALDLRLAMSTVSERCTRALQRLGLSGRRVPLQLAIAAQCSSGWVAAKAVRCDRFVEHGAAHVMLSIPRPDLRHASSLSDAERDVARMVIEGLALAAIAEQRGSSMYTVANQKRRVFSVLRVSGRYALIRRAAELGCFD